MARKTEPLVLRMWNPFGKRLDVATTEILRIMLQARTVGFLTLVIGVFVTFDALALRDKLDLLSTTLIWTIIVPLQMVLYILMDITWALGQRRLGLGRIYVPVLGLLAYALNSIFFAAVLALLTGQSFTASYDPQLIMLGYPLALIFEIFFFTFVLPVLMARAGSDGAAQAHNRAESASADLGASAFNIAPAAAPHLAPQTAPQPAPQASQPAPRVLCVARESIPVDSLLVLKSKEHHVVVVTDSGSTCLRARLADIVDQTGPADGVHAHRSHWIARRAIAGFTPGHGNQPSLIELTDGTSLPVARPRLTEVRGWLDAHMPDLAPREVS